MTMTDIQFHITSQMVFQPTTKTPYTLVWFSDDVRLIFTLHVRFVGRVRKIEERYWIEADSFVHSSIPEKSDEKNTTGNKGTPYPHVHAPHTQKRTILVFHALKNFHMFKHFLVNSTFYISLTIKTFFVT